MCQRGRQVPAQPRKDSYRLRCGLTPWPHTQGARRNRKERQPLSWFGISLNVYVGDSEGTPRKIPQDSLPTCVCCPIGSPFHTGRTWEIVTEGSDGGGVQCLLKPELDVTANLGNNHPEILTGEETFAQGLQKPHRGW